MTDKRISHLADRIVCHLVTGQTHKALLIAQYLRSQHGYRLVSYPTLGPKGR